MPCAFHLVAPALLTGIFKVVITVATNHCVIRLPALRCVQLNAIIALSLNPLVNAGVTITTSTNLNDRFRSWSLSPLYSSLTFTYGFDSELASGFRHSHSGNL